MNPATEDTNQAQESDRVEHPRLILERQQSRAITLEEASEVGESLITFFEILGENWLWSFIEVLESGGP